MSYPPFSITVAGRRLAVRGDPKGLAAVVPGFAGVAEPLRGAAQAELEIQTVADPAGEGFWRGRELGVHRYPDGAVALISRGPSSVETYRPGMVPQLKVAASPDALASGELRAQPANQAIASWLAGPTTQLVHGAAVALDGRGVLLVGVSGRGKTTTALACAQAGFSFLGDDLCVVESGSADGASPGRIHGLYATAKLTPESRERLGISDWPWLGVTALGKDAVCLPPAIRFDRQVPLVAIVGVCPGGEAVGAVRRVTGTAAVRMLASTALVVRTGSGTPVSWLRSAASIARAVPAYELGLGWDLDRVVAAVRSVVLADSAAARRGPR